MTPLSLSLFSVALPFHAPRAMRQSQCREQFELRCAVAAACDEEQGTRDEVRTFLSVVPLPAFDHCPRLVTQPESLSLDTRSYLYLCIYIYVCLYHSSRAEKEKEEPGGGLRQERKKSRRNLQFSLSLSLSYSLAIPQLFVPFVNSSRREEADR